MHPSWDKYESKMKFWVEEDVEVEWQKSQSRRERESMEYDVDAGESAGVMMAPSLDMGAAQSAGHRLQTPF